MKLNKLLVIDANYIMEPCIKLYYHFIQQTPATATQFAEIIDDYGLDTFLCFSQKNLQFLSELIEHVKPQGRLSVFSDCFSLTEKLQAEQVKYDEVTFIGWMHSMSLSQRDVFQLQLGQLTLSNWMMDIMETSNAESMLLVTCKNSFQFPRELAEFSLTESRGYPDLFLEYDRVMLNLDDLYVPPQFRSLLRNLIEGFEINAKRRNLARFDIPSEGFN